MTQQSEDQFGTDATGSALLSRREAADLLNVSIRTFDRIQIDDKIPFVTIGKRKKYLKRDIEVYIMGQRGV